MHTHMNDNDDTTMIANIAIANVHSTHARIMFIIDDCDDIAHTTHDVVVMNTTHVCHDDYDNVRDDNFAYVACVVFTTHVHFDDDTCMTFTSYVNEYDTCVDFA